MDRRRLGSASTAAGRRAWPASGIPIESRIVRVACAFDATVGRAGQGADPRLAACAPAAAVDELRRAAGTELDARVIAALAALLERAAP